MENKTTLNTAMTILEKCIRHNLANRGGSNASYIVPILWSLPGEGKTTMVEDLTDRMELSLVTLIAAQFDAGELGGFPIVSGAEYVRARPFFLPTEGIGVLFLDELPQAPIANQNIMAQLVNERRIGEHRLGDGWTIVCAGNPMSAKAGTTAMPTHLQDRLCHIHLRTDVEGFREYALGKGMDPRVTTFLNERPEWLQKFDPKAQACPSPRSWERVNTILGLGLEPAAEAIAIQGMIGEPALADFTGFLHVWGKMPAVKDVLADPLNHSIPEDPAILYALCSSLAHHANASNVKAIIDYTGRFTNKEFTVFCMTDLLSRFPELKKEKPVGDWFFNEGQQLML